MVDDSWQAENSGNGKMQTEPSCKFFATETSETEKFN
jgi:hypothetical protein